MKTAKTETKLETGKTYSAEIIERFERFVGGDGDYEGYEVQGYFRDGKYLGKDEYGVEPTFCADSE